MGKPGKWLKSVLLGKKPSKSSGSKEKEVLVISKVEESDIVSDLPSIGHEAVLVETQNQEHEDVSDNEIKVSEVEPKHSQDTASVPDDLISESQKQEQIAAVTVQAAYRGYLARRSFRILKGIIRLQAVFRGHMVRRQAVSTLYCVMGVVKIQALVRGRKIRHSDIGVEVHRKYQLHYQDNKLSGSVGIKNLTANAFARKLLASSPDVMPLSNDSSNSIWLENWSASCFWKPVPQPKKETSVRKTEKKFASSSNGDNSSVAQTSSLKFEKSKRSFRKVSVNQSVESLTAMEDPQVDLEKVKRGLRKVHNPVVENSFQPQPIPDIAVEKPSPSLEESVNVFDGEKGDEMSETMVKQPEELIQSHEPLRGNEAFDSTLVNQIEESEVVMAEEKRTPKQNHKDSPARKEDQKSKKGSLIKTIQTGECEESSNGVQTSSNQRLPSYMQATKSAKAKLRQQGSSSPKQQGSTEKVSRRYSLPSSGNGAKVSSQSPKTRVSSSGGKTGKKTEKTSPVEWKR